MLRTTSQALFEYFDNDTGIITNAIKQDLFGLKNCDDERVLVTLLGVYKGLYIMNVSHQEVHEHFLKNSLDDLIHSTYQNRHSDYYDDFCRYNISIGKTYFKL